MELLADMKIVFFKFYSMMVSRAQNLKVEESVHFEVRLEEGLDGACDQSMLY